MWLWEIIQGCWPTACNEQVTPQHKNYVAKMLTLGRLRGYSVQNMSNLNAYVIQLGILFKCRFWYGASRMGPDVLHFVTCFPVDIDVSDLLCGPLFEDQGCGLILNSHGNTLRTSPARILWHFIFKNIFWIFLNVSTSSFSINKILYVHSTWFIYSFMLII